MCQIPIMIRIQAYNERFMSKMRGIKSTFNNPDYNIKAKITWQLWRHTNIIRDASELVFKNL